MTKSYSYIAQGVVGNVHYMKVGKANNLHRRSKEIGLSIERFIECSDEDEAFSIESWLRNILSVYGAVRARGKDWFAFNGTIYERLLNAAKDINGESAYLVRVRSLQMQVAALEQEVKRLKPFEDEVRVNNCLIEMLSEQIRDKEIKVVELIQEKALLEARHPN